MRLIGRLQPTDPFLVGHRTIQVRDGHRWRPTVVVRMRQWASWPDDLKGALLSGRRVVDVGPDPWLTRCFRCHAEPGCEVKGNLETYRCGCGARWRVHREGGIVLPREIDRREDLEPWK